MIIQYIKSPAISGNIISDEDYFMLNLYKLLSGNIRKNTYEQIQNLFKKFEYKYNFKREDVEQIFEVRKSRVSEIIALLLDKNLIQQSEPTKYKFKK